MSESVFSVDKSEYILLTPFRSGNSKEKKMSQRRETGIVKRSIF